MTIRRGLEALAESGQVCRVFGGANAAQSTAVEQVYVDRMHLNHEVKEAIAGRALRETPDGGKLARDGSTTSAYLARRLVEHDIVVMTSRLLVQTLADADGGRAPRQRRPSQPHPWPRPTDGQAEPPGLPRKQGVLLQRRAPPRPRSLAYARPGSHPQALAPRDRWALRRVGRQLEVRPHSAAPPRRSRELGLRHCPAGRGLYRDQRAYVGNTFDPGPIGEHTVRADETGQLVLLGPPFIFDADNHDDFNL